MGTITGQQIVDKAWIILQDTAGSTGVRWPATECLLWLNDGQREVAINLPSAFVKTTIATLTAGTRQSLSGLGLTDGVQFLKMPRNFASNGTTPGRAVTVRPIAWIDEQKPNWHNDTAAEVAHVFFDPNDPKTFYNWPPATGSGKGEIVYTAVPPVLAALADAIALDDIYANALQYYLLFRAFSKNSVYTKSPAAATGYYQLFLQSLGIKDKRVMALDANRQMLSDGAGLTGGEGG